MRQMNFVAILSRLFRIDAERRVMHSHALRGNEKTAPLFTRRGDGVRSKTAISNRGFPLDRYRARRHNYGNRFAGF